MRDPASLRRKAGIRPDPNADQYFLEDPRVLDRIVDAATSQDISLAETLEIGPGTGALTARLLAVADHLTVIERDRSLARFLETEFAEQLETGQLTIRQGDATEVDLPRFTACVSNLPYGISSPILFRLLPEREPLVVLVQREFAERMVGNPGTSDYGRLAVAVGYYADARILEVVPPSAFYPEPPVESAIVRVLPRAPGYDVNDETLFFAILRGVFTQRRKTLRNALRNTTHITGISKVDRLIDQLDSDLLSKRPDAITPEEYAEIARIAQGSQS